MHTLMHNAHAQTIGGSRGGPPGRGPFWKNNGDFIRNNQIISERHIFSS